MDILTPAGQETLRQENAAVEIWHHHYPDYRYTHTNKLKPVGIDALLVRGEQLKAAVETKCRQMALRDFGHVFRYEWLVTFEKLVKARDTARALGVPLLGMLYLVPDDLLLFATLFDHDGQATRAMRLEVTRTRATVNGGVAVRTNAFIDMHSATVLNRAGERAQLRSPYSKSAASVDHDAQPSAPTVT